MAKKKRIDDAPDAPKLDLEKFSEEGQAQLARRGRAISTNPSGLRAGNLMGSLTPEQFGMVGEVASQILAQNILPVSNVQQRHRMRLDPRSFSGSLFSDLVENISQNERPERPVFEYDHGGGGADGGGDAPGQSGPGGGTSAPGAPPSTVTGLQKTKLALNVLTTPLTAVIKPWMLPLKFYSIIKQTKALNQQDIDRINNEFDDFADPVTSGLPADEGFDPLSRDDEPDHVTTPPARMKNPPPEDEDWSYGPGGSGGGSPSSGPGMSGNDADEGADVAGAVADATATTGPDDSDDADMGEHGPSRGGGDAGGNGGNDGGGGMGSASGDAGCFVAGTQILMSDGTTKSIENIRIGDIVMSFPENSVGAPLEPQKVLHTFYGEDHAICELPDGTKCTPNHRFAHEKGFTEAMHMFDVKDAGFADVYNFTVNKNHTYVANGHRVHNMKAAGGTVKRTRKQKTHRGEWVMPRWMVAENPKHVDQMERARRRGPQTAMGMRLKKRDEGK